MSSKLFENAKFNLDNEMKNQDFRIRATIWKRNYQEVVEQGLSVENLPLALALIHPDFRINWQGESFSIPDGRFNDITNNENCQSFKVLGYECPWNKDVEIRGNLENDHYWPASLGGPTDNHNRLPLCRIHNEAKSNAISNYDWGNIPKWLLKLLTQIHSKVMWGFSSSEDN
jgi:hypothetical protein